MPSEECQCQRNYIHQAGYDTTNRAQFVGTGRILLRERRIGARGAWGGSWESAESIPGCIIVVTRIRAKPTRWASNGRRRSSFGKSWQNLFQQSSKQAAANSNQ